MKALFLSTAWPGVDESVVEHYAKQAGRAAKPPLINVDQGDLLLFLFLLAGLIGGFVIGYYWRVLFTDSRKTGKERNYKETSNKGEG